jgi:hypothetical protein
MTLSLAAAVGLDYVRQARAIVRPTGPVANHSHAMFSMLTARGKVATKDGHIDLAGAMAFRWEKGAEAPEFTLPAVRADRRVALADLRGKPAVLVFASLTCVIFHDHVKAIERLTRAHGDRVAWLFVNITEARHTIPGLEFLLADGDLTARPAGLSERRRNVARGLNAVGLSLPAVIDVGRTAEAAYDAYPLRLVAVDAEGKVAVDLGRGAPPGPGWDLGVLERWLKEQPAARAGR